MDLAEIRETVADCSLPEYAFRVVVDGRGAWYLQATYTEPDVHTGKPAMQYTRRWFLSPEMTKSEVAQTCLKCALTSAEHRVREWFRYRGRAVFGPHMSLERLWEIAEETRERHG
jgi:hypothetical protein